MKTATLNTIAWLLPSPATPSIHKSSTHPPVDINVIRDPSQLVSVLWSRPLLCPPPSYRLRPFPGQTFSPIIPQTGPQPVHSVTLPPPPPNTGSVTGETLFQTPRKPKPLPTFWRLSFSRLSILLFRQLLRYMTWRWDLTSWPLSANPS